MKRALRALLWRMLYTIPVVWLVVSLGYMMAFGCPRIVLMVGLAFFPYCMGALLGHNVGRFHHPAHWDGIEMEFDD